MFRDYATLGKKYCSISLQNGAFKSREELKKVPMMGPKSFEQCAGFLRIRMQKIRWIILLFIRNAITGGTNGKRRAGFLGRTD